MFVSFDTSQFQICNIKKVSGQKIDQKFKMYHNRSHRTVWSINHTDTSYIPFKYHCQFICWFTRWCKFEWYKYYKNLILITTNSVTLE